MSYYTDRMTALGATDDNLTVLVRNEMTPSAQRMKVFDETPQGDIEIIYPSLAGGIEEYDRGKKVVRYSRTRYAAASNGRRYNTPHGAGTRLFIPPTLIDKYQAAETLPTLIVVEGEFKAFAAAVQGQPAVGLQGIHCIKNKETGQLYPELDQLVTQCQVKNLVLLFDSDCLEVKPEDVAEKKDLFTRPNSFYTAVRNFREQVKHLPVDTYFAHLTTKEKGLDDLLAARAGEAQAIVAELNSLTRAQHYFKCQNITDKNLKAIKSYFGITSKDEFYSKYEDVIGEAEFTYAGGKYVFENDKVQTKFIPELIPYLRIGTEYHKRVKAPTINGKQKEELRPWQIGAIVDDHAKDGISAKHIRSMIPKYEGFCNVPSHTNYQQVVQQHYNKYLPMEYKPHPGECPQSLAMVRHIFGDRLYELGLDYIQLLYLEPTQALPILCLVSETNSTGKSTFAKWLKAIFGQNATFCTNRDFDSQFNDDYTSKLLICVDEAYILPATRDYLKFMSTAKTAKSNAKNQAKQELEFFGKFILCSNDEENFVQVNENEVRWLVLKVDKPAHDLTNIQEELEQEIPAFLHLLSSRRLAHERVSRMYFSEAQIKTEAFTKMVNANKSSTRKEIEDYLGQIMMNFSLMEIKMPATTLLELLTKNPATRITRTQLTHALRKEMKLSPSSQAQRFCVPIWKDETGLVHDERGHSNCYTFQAKDILSREELKELETEHLKKENSQIPF